VRGWRLTALVKAGPKEEHTRKGIRSHIFCEVYFDKTNIDETALFGGLATWEMLRYE
jgi:hypothetical protein